MSAGEILLSGFADEAAIDKKLDQQCTAIAALGMSYLTLRFVDVGTGTKNIIDCNDREIDEIVRYLETYDLRVSSIGSPIGKSKLIEIDDGTRNPFFPFPDYLDQQVQRCCEIASHLNCRLVRGFSFYPPNGEDPLKFVDEAARRIRQIVEICADYGLIFGLELEANLVGRNAELLMRIHELVDHPGLCLVFDGANLVTQGYGRAEILQQFQTMLPALGWIHIKDHRKVAVTAGQYIDEDRFDQFVVAGRGESGYGDVLAELKKSGKSVWERNRLIGLPGIFADLEPHLKQGGQYGGFSGPDGFGVAARAFQDLCGQVGLSCPVRDSDSFSSSTSP